MTTEKELSWEEWKTLGILLQRIRTKLVKQISNTTHRKARPLKRQLNPIDLARSALDDIVFEQFPEKSTDELCKVIYNAYAERRAENNRLVAEGAF